MASKLLERIKSDLQHQPSSTLNWSDDGPGYADEWSDGAEYSDSGGATPADPPSS